MFSCRFLVLCTYQPDTLTVRASFTVPGKNGVASVAPSWESSDRSARDRKFRMVDKSGLVLKAEPEVENKLLSGQPNAKNNELAGLSADKQLNLSKEDKGEGEIDESYRNSKYARLVDHRQSVDEGIVPSSRSK